MYAVGDTFDGHVVNEIDTFYCAFVLVAHLVVESGHGVVEVCDVGEAGFEGGFDVFVFGIGVSDAGQDAFFCAVSAEL